jgi:energy-coupling factor transport system substrate-specific component
MRINRTLSLSGLLALCFLLLLLSIWWVDNYLWLSFGMIITAILLFFSRFENKKLEARELVLLAVLASIAAVGRIPFASIPSVQPTTFVIMMTGLVFGAESGFMVGAVAALASNMVLGQGPWTPWQMVAWGLVGLTSGLLGKSKFLNHKCGRVLFGIVWGFLFGWIMNLWGLLSLAQSGMVLDAKAFITYFAGSVLFDSMHSLSNVFFLLVFGEIWMKQLMRFKRKYGLLK